MSSMKFLEIENNSHFSSNDVLMRIEGKITININNILFIRPSAVEFSSPSCIIKFVNGDEILFFSKYDEIVELLHGHYLVGRLKNEAKNDSRKRNWVCSKNRKRNC